VGARWKPRRTILALCTVPGLRRRRPARSAGSRKRVADRAGLGRPAVL